MTATISVTIIQLQGPADVLQPLLDRLPLPVAQAPALSETAVSPAFACIHHWRINGAGQLPFEQGTCVKCGEVRQFGNVWEPSTGFEHPSPRQDGFPNPKGGRGCCRVCGRGSKSPEHKAHLEVPT